MGAVVGRKVLPALLIMALVAGAVATVAVSVQAIRYRYPLDYGEGPLLEQAVRLSHGLPIYLRPGATPPWTISAYPPLYPLLLSAFVGWTGPAFWYGRLVTMISFAVAALLVGLITARVTRRRFAGLVAGLLLLVLPAVVAWSAYARIDGTALALSLGGLWSVVVRPQRRSSAVIAVLLLTAAACTRQTYLLAGPLAAFGWLWPHSRRRAIGLALGFAASVALVWTTLGLLTQNAFWFDIVVGNLNEYDPSALIGWTLYVAPQIPLLVVLGPAAVVATMITIRRDATAARLLIPYTAGALVVAATIAKVGSGVNYLLELSVAACFAVGILLDRWWQRPLLRPVLLGLLLAQVGYLLFQVPGLTAYTREFVADPASAAQLLDVVENAGGPVLADQDLGLLPLSGRPVELEPFELTQLSRTGHWDQTAAVAALDRHRYAVVLVYTLDSFPGLENTRWTDAMLASLHHGYTVTSHIDRPFGTVLVYRPR